MPSRISVDCIAKFDVYTVDTLLQQAPFGLRAYLLTLVWYLW